MLKTKSFKIGILTVILFCIGAGGFIRSQALAESTGQRTVRLWRQNKAGAQESIKAEQQHQTLFEQIQEATRDAEREAGHRTMRLWWEKKTGKKWTIGIPQESEIPAMQIAETAAIEQESAEEITLRKPSADVETVAETGEPLATDEQPPVAEQPAIAPKVQAAVDEQPVTMTKVPLLEILPAETLFCVRINNLDKTLAATDDYLAGATPLPMPVSMLAKAQLGNILGDPMLTGVDTAADVVFFGVVPGQGGGEQAFGKVSERTDVKRRFKRKSEPATDTKPEPIDAAQDLSAPIVAPTGAAAITDIAIAALVPVKSYKEFIEGNPNRSAPDEQGVSIISPPQSPLGNLVSIAAGGNRFALITIESKKDSLLSLKNVLQTSALSGVLDAAEQTRAREESLWAYSNIRQVSAMFGPMLFDKLEQIKQQIPATPDAAAMQMSPAAAMDMYAEAIRTLLDESQYLSTTAMPTAEKLNVSYSLGAVAGSPLADMLTRTEQTRSESKLAGYLSGTDALNIIVKSNKSLNAKLFNAYMNGILKLLGENFTAEQQEEWRSLMADYLDIMGDELAVAFSFAQGQPPFALKEIIMVEDMKDFKTVTDKSMEMFNEIYKEMEPSMGMSMSFSYAPDTDEYEGVSIDTMTIKFEFPDTNVGVMQAQMVNSMYGEALSYQMALTDNMALITMGPDADADIRDLIDLAKSSSAKAPAGDIKTAMSLVPNAADADVIASVNYLRILSGLGSFFKSMPMPQMQMMGEMFSQMDAPTQSCIAMSATVAKGKAQVDIVIPKQHLIEIITAGQLLQQQMQQQMAPPQPGM